MTYLFSTHYFFLTTTASGDLLAENFNPVWFLLEAHRYTSFFDLKMGLRRLQREVEQSDQAPVQFMRDNLDIFIQSYDTLSDILFVYMHLTLMSSIAIDDTCMW